MKFGVRVQNICTFSHDLSCLLIGQNARKKKVPMTGLHNYGIVLYNSHTNVSLMNLKSQELSETLYFIYKVL